MKELQKEYETMKEEQKNIQEEIKELKTNKYVDRYITLCQKSYEIKNQIKETYKKMKFDEYKKCQHIWVYDLYTSYNGSFCGCIKCGLDQSINDIIYTFGDDVLLTEEEKIMYQFMKKNYVKTGICSDTYCNLNLAKAIYKKIKENNPNISDKEALKYLEIALDNIRNIKVNETRQESRAKRLSLSPKFNRWTPNDIKR